jgi:hypothetical protein
MIVPGLLIPNIYLMDLNMVNWILFYYFFFSGVMTEPGVLPKK